MSFDIRFVARFNGLEDGSWQNYQCGYCGSSTNGFVVANYPTSSIKRQLWLCCTVCEKPAVMTTDGRIFPALPFGPIIQGLPDDVSKAYEEARQCFSVNAFTACELICRKILMHIGVDKGAEEGKTFEFYIDYLESQGYVNLPMKPWVSLIRTHGNLSTHRLSAPDEARSKSTLMFTAELLRLVYEMEYMSGIYTLPAPH